jgi:hypothetical protein
MSSDIRITFNLPELRNRIYKQILRKETTFRFTITTPQQLGEYVQSEITCEVNGVTHGPEDACLTLLVSIIKMDPVDIPIQRRALEEFIESKVQEWFPYAPEGVLKGSIVHKSIKDLRYMRRLNQFKNELHGLVEARKISIDDALVKTMEFIEDSISGSSFASVEDIHSKKSTPKSSFIIEITPPGVPCPHCRGNLSGEALMELMERLHFKHGFRPDFFGNGGDF